MNVLEIPLSFFEIVPAMFYNIIRLFLFFIFDYKIIGGASTVLSFVNPFSGADYSLTVPALDLGIIDKILDFFDFDLNLTFFEIMVGPGIILILAYAVIKYLIPVS